MSNYRGLSPLLILVVVALLIGAGGVWWAMQKDATTAQQEDAGTTIPEPTTYPLFDEKNATVGLKVGTFTLSDIVDTGHGKSYVFTGSSTISGTYRLDGIDGPYFQTDKPFIDDAHVVVTIPNYGFYFTNGEKAHSVLREGRHIIVVSGYTYNGAVIANDGRPDTTTFISVVE